jgi:hypothetical protein
MDCHSEFDNAEVGPQVSAVGIHRLDDPLAYLCSQLQELLEIEGFELRGRRDLVKESLRSPPDAPRQ